MSKQPNPRTVEFLNTYTYEEAANALSVAVVTVRSWVHNGDLPVMTSKRPHLMRGSDIRTFFESRRSKRRRKMDVGKFHFVSCKGCAEPMVIWSIVSQTWLQACIWWRCVVTAKHS